MDGPTVTTFSTGFESLSSESVYVEGVSASTVSALWYRLAHRLEVKQIANYVASDNDLIHQLCDHVESLLGTPAEPGYRHANDIAACAALVALSSSPLSKVRQLFLRLASDERPSLFWVRQIALYQRERFTESIQPVLRLSSGVRQSIGISLDVSSDTPTWTDPRVDQYACESA